MKKTFSTLLILILLLGCTVGMTLNAEAAESYLWPVPASTKINQYYSSGHDGLDIGGSLNTPVVSTMSGTVVAVIHGDVAGKWIGYGNGVVVKHSNGYYSHYAHMNSTSVSNGQYVSQGQEVGKMGSTGNSTGVHLHFAIATSMYGGGGRINNNPGTISYIYSNPTPSPSSYFKSVWSSDVGETDAKINATITGTNLSTCGFYIGKSQSSMEKKTETVNGYVENIWYTMSADYGTLTKGTTYYYKFFIVVGGVEYCSDVYTFKTGGCNHSYTSKITTAPTCTKSGVRTYSCSCGSTYTETVAAKGHTAVTDKAIEATCTQTGLTQGKHCSVCGTVITAQQLVNAKGHSDANADNICDSCGEVFSVKEPDTENNCDCMCHKTGFAKIIYVIVRLFWKLFGTNETCACGAEHY